MDFKQHHKPTFDNIPKEKKKRIIDVATKEFAKNGYHDASISSIAGKSGISVGAVYKYFENKQDLFLTIVDESIRQMEKMLLGLAKEDVDVIIKVEKILREIIRSSREESILIKLYNSMTALNDDKLARQFAREMEAVTSEIYVEAIREGQKTGEVRDDIDPQIAAWLIDNLFMSLQFSYSGAYYSERLRVYCGDDIEEKDEYVIGEVLKFIKSALKTVK